MSYKIGIIGLGYVGFPLACLFAKKYPVVAFDINTSRVKALQSGEDSTLEVSSERIAAALQNGMLCTDRVEDLKNCNIYIVTVPTPVNENNYPDLRPLESASATVGSVISEGDIVIYESTVYPGVTEEVCAPIIEKVSGKKLNSGFFLGYSPERINPGDKEHTVEKIKKITSGSTEETAQIVDSLYNSVLENGTFKASSIKVAEAAKIIENSQRDVNIAFMNEVAMIMNALGIDTNDVLEAAGTKWNFLKFYPGLVGGHCIGVDPYYMVYKANEMNYHPHVIQSGRFVNDSMGGYIGKHTVKKMIANGISPVGARVLVMGITFKENVADVRNSKVADIVKELESFSIRVDVVDPHADPTHVEREYGIKMASAPTGKYQAVVAAVSHNEYAHLTQDDFANLLTPDGILIDVKGKFKGKIDKYGYWSL